MFKVMASVGKGLRRASAKFDLLFDLVRFRVFGFKAEAAELVAVGEDC